MSLFRNEDTQLRKARQIRRVAVVSAMTLRMALGDAMEYTKGNEEFEREFEESIVKYLCNSNGVDRALVPDL